MRCGPVGKTPPTQRGYAPTSNRVKPINANEISGTRMDTSLCGKRVGARSMQLCYRKRRRAAPFWRECVLAPLGPRNSVGRMDIVSRIRREPTLARSRRLGLRRLFFAQAVSDALQPQPAGEGGPRDNDQ